jgi:3-dehydroquinate dehydratase-2
MIIHVLNGPNLNLVGRREPGIYGTQNLQSYFEELKAEFPQDELHYFQSNHEGALLDYLHNIGFTKCGVVFNAGAYTHTSIALADAIKAINAPVVEVHISNVYEREAFRHHSFLKENCVHTIVGKGLKGYAEGIAFLKSYQEPQT